MNLDRIQELEATKKNVAVRNANSTTPMGISPLEKEILEMADSGQFNTQPVQTTFTPPAMPAYKSTPTLVSLQLQGMGETMNLELLKPTVTFDV